MVDQSIGIKIYNSTSQTEQKKDKQLTWIVSNDLGRPPTFAKISSGEVEFKLFENSFCTAFSQTFLTCYLNMFHFDLLR